MRKEREEKFDPSQPALIVTYGNTTRKHRPLESDLVVIGRSSCCDVGLVSPEVAPIHCVIVKIADSWRIRDCTGRSGTRVNGKSIHDEPLNDGDTLQIGTFSFQMNLPRRDGAAPVPPAASVLNEAPTQATSQSPDPAKHRHLQQSRERLARHALNLRRKLRQQSASALPNALVAPSRLDAEQFARRSELAEREKQLALLQAELTEQDHAFQKEYSQLASERKELQRFAQETLLHKQAELERKADAQVATRLARATADLEQRAVGLQAREQALESERCQLEENLLKTLTEQKSELAAREAHVQRRQSNLEEQLKQVEELNADLTEAREGLRLEFTDIDHLRAQTQAELDEQIAEAEAYVETLVRQWEAHQQRLEEKHGPLLAWHDLDVCKHDLSIRARELEAYAQHMERTRVMLRQYEKDLAEAYQQFHVEYDNAIREAQTLRERSGDFEDALDLGAPSTSGLTGLETHIAPRHAETQAFLAQMREEWDSVRSDLTTKADKERERAERSERKLQQLEQELRQREEVLEHLRAELQQYEKTARRAVVSDGVMLKAPEEVLELVEKLQRELADRKQQFNELQHRSDKLQRLSDPSERLGYEEELNHYRVELEQDRLLLNEEIARLQALRVDVDEARHETELHSSRERAQIAREWAEINRVREQLRREHAKRDHPASGTDSGKVKSDAGETKSGLSTPCPTSSTPTPTPQPDLISRLVPRGSKHSIGLTPR